MQQWSTFSAALGECVVEEGPDCDMSFHRDNSRASNVKWAQQQSQAQGGVSEKAPFPA